MVANIKKCLGLWVALAVLVAAGCGGEATQEATNCSVESEDGVTTITCPDGSSATVEDGALGGDGEDGATGLVAATEEAGGDNCENGGIRIDYGVDENGDGVLDEEEVDDTTYVCDGLDGEDGADGRNTLVVVANEEPGDNCQAGGQRIDTGLDATGDGQLQEEEVEQTSYVCHGTDGEDGSDGVDGVSSLVETSVEEPGDNCDAGGYRIDVGLDVNGDGVLETDEIGQTSYVCDGVEGAAGADGSDGADGLNSLVEVSPESAGTNCENGGHRIDVGLDTNADGTLQDDEISATEYVCVSVEEGCTLTPMGDRVSITCGDTTVDVPANCAEGDTTVADGCELTTVCGATPPEVFAGGNCSNNHDEFANWWCQLGGYESAVSYDVINSNVYDSLYYQGGDATELTECSQVEGPEGYGFADTCTGVENLVCTF